MSSAAVVTGALKVKLNFLYSAGAYEHDLRRNRKVQWHQSFGFTCIDAFNQS